MNVCVTIISLAGWFCALGGVPVGECIEMSRDTIACTAEVKDVQVRLSAYDPDWCWKHPTNCDGDTLLGTGLPHADWYWFDSNDDKNGIACPAEWSWLLVTIENVGTGRCVDSGGAIRPTWVQVGDEMQLVIVLDILYSFGTCDPSLGECWPWWALRVHNWELWGEM